MEQEQLFVTINEAAQKTGLSRAYIRQLCKGGKAPCLRIGGGKNAVYKIHFQKLLEMLDSMAETEVES